MLTEHFKIYMLISNILDTFTRKENKYKVNCNYLIITYVILIAKTSNHII